MNHTELLPTKASAIPKVTQLGEKLGLGSTEKRKVFERLKFDARSFKQDFAISDGTRGHELRDLKDMEHRELLVEMAAKFDEQYGARYWPEARTEALSGQEAAKRRKYLTQLFFRTNDQSVRNVLYKKPPKNSTDEQSSTAADSVTTSRTTEISSSSLQIVPDVSGPSDTTDSASHGINTTDDGAASPSDLGPAAAPVVELRGPSNGDVSLNSYTHVFDQPGDVDEQENTASIRRTLSDGTQQDSQGITLPAQVVLSRDEYLASRTVQSQKQEENTDTDATARKIKRMPKTNSHAWKYLMRRPDSPLQPTGDNLCITFYITNNTYGRMRTTPWVPEGKFLDLSLDDLVHQMSLNKSPPSILFRLRKPGCSSLREEVVSIQGRDEKRFEIMKRGFEREVIEALTSVPAPLGLVKFDVEMKLCWDDDGMRNESMSTSLF